MVWSGVLVSTGNTIDYVYGLFAAYAAGIDFTVGREGGREQSTGSQLAVTASPGRHGARQPTTHSLLRLLARPCVRHVFNQLNRERPDDPDGHLEQPVAGHHLPGNGGGLMGHLHPPTHPKQVVPASRTRERPITGPGPSSAAAVQSFQGGLACVGAGEFLSYGSPFTLWGAVLGETGLVSRHHHGRPSVVVTVLSSPDRRPPSACLPVLWLLWCGRATWRRCRVASAPSWGPRWWTWGPWP